MIACERRERVRRRDERGTDNVGVAVGAELF